MKKWLFSFWIIISIGFLIHNVQTKRQKRWNTVSKTRKKKMDSSNSSYQSISCVIKWGNRFTIFHLSLFLYIYRDLFELIYVYLTFGDKEVRVWAGLFLRSKILWYAQNFKWVFTPRIKLSDRIKTLT